MASRKIDCTGDKELIACQQQLAGKLALPVVRPLQEGVEPLLPTIRRFMDRHL